MPESMDLACSSALSKLSNALESDDKFRRKKAMEELKTAIFEENSQTALEDKVQCVYKNILKSFSDKSEACRETAVNLMIEILKNISEESSDYFPYIIPILVQRLGNTEIVEPSEEVRLLLVELYHTIILRFPKVLPNYIEEMVQILLKILNDPYPKIKKDSCDCAMDLSKAAPRHLYSHTKAVVKLILLNFNHQHSRVRVAAVQAVEEVLLRGDSKAVEEALVPLAERLFDQAPAVRRAVLEAVGRWMVDLPDRYSFFARFMPLLLTGLDDVLAELRERAQVLWEMAGQKYLQENEEELKDQIDFVGDAPLPHYPLPEGRPSLGCRALARRQLYWLFGVLGKEVRDWRPDVRLRSVQLLRRLLALAEEHATHYTPALADALAPTLVDEDARIRQAARAAGELLGAMTATTAWAAALVPGDGDPALPCRLLLLAACVRGASASIRCPLASRRDTDATSPAQALFSLLPRVAARLRQDDVCALAATHAATLECADALAAALRAVAGDASTNATENVSANAVGDSSADASEDTVANAAGDGTPCATEDRGPAASDRVTAKEGDAAVVPQDLADADVVVRDLFQALLTVQATAVDAATALEAKAVQERLGGAEGRCSLWARLVPPLLAQLAEDDPSQWPPTAPARHLVEAVLAESAADGGVGSSLALARPTLLPLLAALAAPPDQPPERRLRLMTLLASRLCEGALLEGDGARPFAVGLASEVLAPALVWRAGRTAEALRAAAAACLLSLLRTLTSAEGEEHAEKAEDAMTPLLPLLPALIQDGHRRTRHLALRCAPLACGIVAKPWDHLIKMYTVALERLDDVDEDVRVASVNCVERLLRLLRQTEEDAERLRPHLQLITDSLLLHLDDADERLQRALLRTLKVVAVTNPALMREKVLATLPNARNSAAYKELMLHLEVLYPSGGEG